MARTSQVGRFLNSTLENFMPIAETYFFAVVKKLETQNEDVQICKKKCREQFSSKGHQQAVVQQGLTSSH